MAVGWSLSTGLTPGSKKSPHLISHHLSVLCSHSLGLLNPDYPQICPHLVHHFQLTALLTLVCSKCSSIHLLGDFNIHVDSTTLSFAVKFLSLLDCFKMTQYVQIPTPRSTSTSAPGSWIFFQAKVDTIHQHLLGSTPSPLHEPHPLSSVLLAASLHRIFLIVLNNQ